MLTILYQSPKPQIDNGKKRLCITTQFMYVLFSCTCYITFFPVYFCSEVHVEYHDILLHSEKNGDVV